MNDKGLVVYLIIEFSIAPKLTSSKPSFTILLNRKKKKKVLDEGEYVRQDEIMQKIEQKNSGQLHLTVLRFVEFQNGP